MIHIHKAEKAIIIIELSKCRAFTDTYQHQLEKNYRGNPAWRHQDTELNPITSFGLNIDNLSKEIYGFNVSEETFKALIFACEI